MGLPESPRARWLSALAVCAIVVAISTQISREMTFWGAVASLLLLLWLWLALMHPKPPSDPEA